MEWRQRAVTLLACLLVVVARASSREIAQDIMDSHMRHLQENRRTVQLLKNLLEDLDVNMETVQKRTACYISAGMGHSCDYRDIIGAADEANKTVERVKKWCANTGSDSCGNMYVPGSGDDEDYLNSGDTPGKRSLLKRLIAYRNRARLLKCSTNTGDDSCGNGYVPGSGDDDDYLNNGDNPGKRSLNILHHRPVRCSTNTGDDSCGNGYVPGSGNDNDYLNNGDNPGKRAAAKPLSLHQLRLLRCSTNTGDDSCGNGYVPGSGDDNDYLNGDDNPGKRAISKLFGILQNRPTRCSTNTGDDSCGNGYVPGSGNDNDYLNNGDNPGKRASHSFRFPENERSVHSEQASSARYVSLKDFCSVFPMKPDCRNLK